MYAYSTRTADQYKNPCIIRFIGFIRQKRWVWRVVVLGFQFDTGKYACIDTSYDLGVIKTWLGYAKDADNGFVCASIVKGANDVIVEYR